jgi:hypothetical protein
MVDLTVERRRRYGRDRLYVLDGSGNRVGWQELPSGEVILERSDLAEDVERSLSAYVEVD